MLNHLSPVIHQYNHDLYRVPMRRLGDKYTMYVGDNFTREFDDTTLPDEVKIKMAMILARQKLILHDMELTQLALMSTANDVELQEVGWRASDSWYCIVLPYTSLMKLRGEEHGDDT